MEAYTYLIIGGGVAADAAVRGIRELDFTSRIGIVSEENYPPYDKHALSQGLWFGKQRKEIWRKTEKERVVLHLGRKIVSIDPEAKIAKDHVGNTYWYDKLLIATGGTPKKLELPETNIKYLRSLSDYQEIRELYEKGNEFVIVGAGFIGTDLASAFSLNGKKVTLIFIEPSIGFSKLPKGLSSFLNALFTEKGVQLAPAQTIDRVSQKEGKYLVETTKKEKFSADGIIAGIGIEPSLKLALDLKLDIEDGILVDRYLQTSRKEIFAAGDVANFYSPHLEKRVRIEHSDAAKSQGFQAGRNMAGAKEAYEYLPFYTANIFDLGYEAIGEISADMEIIEDWLDPYRMGTIYYLREGKLKGAMLWGIWNKIEQVRDMIASKKTFHANTLIGTFKG